MRMKMVCDDRTLRDVANEFLALKKAQKVRDRTLSDYRKYLDKFLAQSENVLDAEILKTEILHFLCGYFGSRTFLYTQKGRKRKFAAGSFNTCSRISIATHMLCVVSWE